MLSEVAGVPALRAWRAAPDPPACLRKVHAADQLHIRGSFVAEQLLPILIDSSRVYHARYRISCARRITLWVRVPPRLPRDRPL